MWGRMGCDCVRGLLDVVVRGDNGVGGRGGGGRECVVVVGV